MDFGGTPSQIVGFRGASCVASRFGTIFLCVYHMPISLWVQFHKWCIMGYWTGALWDLYIYSLYPAVPSLFRHTISNVVI